APLWPSSDRMAGTPEVSQNLVCHNCSGHLRLGNKLPDMYPAPQVPLIPSLGCRPLTAWHFCRSPTESPVHVSKVTYLTLTIVYRFRSVLFQIFFSALLFPFHAPPVPQRTAHEYRSL